MLVVLIPAKEAAHKKVIRSDDLGAHKDKLRESREI